MWELVPGLFVSSPALGPFLWGDADPLLGRFGLFLLWRRRDVYGVLESMAFIEVRPLRHTYGRNAILNGVPTPVLQQWLGHHSLAETERYVQLAGGHHDWVKRL